MALTGPNGAGKTTLLRLITGDLAPDSGQIKRNDGRIAYLSQRLDLLDLDRTVAENFSAFAPERPEAERMNLLARFLFRGPAPTCPSASSPAANGCAPPWPASCAPSRPPAAPPRRADQQPRPGQRGPAGERARLLPGCLSGGQPRRTVPGRDRREPLAAAGRRRAEGDGSPCGVSSGVRRGPRPRLRARRADHPTRWTVPHAPARSARPRPRPHPGRPAFSTPSP
ncbi:ATP-binding cassette domain-containing protein [Streptomyces nogalater]